MVTDGGSLTRSRARETPETTICAISIERINAAVDRKPELNRVKDLTSADGLEFERYLLNW